MLNLFFIIDEYTDVQSTQVVRDMMTTCMDALQNADMPRPKGENILGEMVRQYVGSNIIAIRFLYKLGSGNVL